MGEMNQGVAIIFESGDFSPKAGGAGDTIIGSLSLNSLVSFLLSSGSQYRTIRVQKDGNILLQK